MSSDRGVPRGFSLLGRRGGLWGRAPQRCRALLTAAEARPHGAAWRVAAHARRALGRGGPRRLRPLRGHRASSSALWSSSEGSRSEDGVDVRRTRLTVRPVPRGEAGPPRLESGDARRAPRVAARSCLTALGCGLGAETFSERPVALPCGQGREFPPEPSRGRVSGGPAPCRPLFSRIMAFSVVNGRFFFVPLI